MSGKSKPTKLQGPKGTRDLYPTEVLKRRYIQNAWRDASLRCGFDEIEGPTFESTELYSVKSGEGILGELFQAYSGKSPNEVEQVQKTGRAPYALRPEFTPTLARMYAAHAKQLPRPCKWFTAGPYFRAERPQRGRLREFLQWNVDFLSDNNTPDGRAQADTETMLCCIAALENLGLTHNDCKLVAGHRGAMEHLARIQGISEERSQKWMQLIDSRPKMSREKFIDHALSQGFSEQDVAELEYTLQSLSILPPHEAATRLVDFMTQKMSVTIDKTASGIMQDIGTELESIIYRMSTQVPEEWFKLDLYIVRGLAYYTGTVFEALADGERAVAGGGRYDNLIELMGGPPTPAVGFAMGDVVLGNLLEDKGLMPEGAELMEAAARPQASIRPEAFVVPNGDEDNEPLVHTLVANLRRGVENEDWLSRGNRKPWHADRYRVRPLHARVSYKSTRNLGKLRADAEKQHAKFFVEIHADNKVEITDMDKRESITSDTHGSFHVDPSAENYVGRALSALC
ncbi:MAG: ATP phosphoribosyltransferase regulatory subunit [Phycisphaerales bacterium]|nr:ATP phosphoribosyltransferase regulatory subunit [Phycisphaerales bacterium]